MNLLDRLERMSPRKLALLVLELQSRLESAQRTRSMPIAIIGMACRFPGGADTPEAFWELLRDGRHAISEIPSTRWDVDGFYDPDPEAPGKMYVRHGGFLSGIDQFDAAFFGISPREATSMDPQHRLLLEVVWEGLERSGQDPAALKGSKTGVFVGITANEYGHLVGSAGPEFADAYAVTGNALNFAAGRLSYVLGLHGPSVAVDTACSASLAAVHLACRSLCAGDCDLALAAGVNLMLQPHATVLLSKARMLSAAGLCRTFDASADGIVRSEGCGLIVLKPLAAAVAAADPILAVIRGSAMNQDGHSSGITVPNGRAQEAVIRDALRDAAVDPNDIGYVEAHGTGTKLGDPIEVRALTAVLGAGRSTSAPLMLGSVKTNIGHAESAAGVAGLIKAVLALQHREIPPHLHLRELNPDIRLEEATIIPTARTPWRAERRVAGVSSFGASGTNVHVVLEGAPPIRPAAASRADRPLHILTVSARSEAALVDLTEQYAAHLAGGAVSLADVCFTANAGRAHFAHRLAIVCGSAAEAATRLQHASSHADPRVVRGHVRTSERPRVAFMFGGGAGPHPSLVQQLHDTQPAFRRAFDRCDEILAGAARTSVNAFEYALAEMWKSWGVEPAAVVGHGVGAQSAACVMGTMRLEDALGAAVGQCSLDVVGTRERVQSAFDGGCRVFLEIGSHALPSSIRQSIVADDVLWLAAGGDETGIWDHLLRALGWLYVTGFKIDWAGFDRDQPRRKIVLPTYPFQRERHWVDAPLPSAPPMEARAASTSISRTRTALDEKLRGDTPQRHRIVGDFCREHLAAVLRLNVVPDETSLSDLGVDSLMAIELRNRIQREFGVSIPVVTLLEAATVAAFADAVVAAVGESVLLPERAAPLQVSAAEAERLLGRMGELSEDEVDALLSALAPQAGASEVRR